MTDLPDLSLEPSVLTLQRERIAGLPEVYRGALERLCIELALHIESPEEIFASHHYTMEEATELVEQPAFIALLQKVTEDVRVNGLAFKHKIRAISEEVLPQALDMIQDPFCSAAVRADLIKWSAKLAGHEPKEVRDDGKTGTGLTLSITFSGNAPQTILSNREPITIEQEG